LLRRVSWRLDDFDDRHDEAESDRFEQGREDAGTDDQRREDRPVFRDANQRLHLLTSCSFSSLAHRLIPYFTAVYKRRYDSIPFLSHPTLDYWLRVLLYILLHSNGRDIQE
jgi:hypothetical protein